MKFLLPSLVIELIKKLPLYSRVHIVDYLSAKVHAKLAQNLRREYDLLFRLLDWFLQFTGLLFGTEPPEEQDLNEETFSATLNPKESLQDIQISPSDIFIHNNRRNSMVPSSPSKDSMLINNSPCKESIFNMSPIKTDDPNDEEIDPL